MATIINNPDGGNSGGGVGMIFGLIILVVLVALFFLYGLPMIRNASKGTTINVPDKVQVDVNTNNAAK